MKKVFYAFAVIGLFALSSCSKEKDCTCTTSSDDPNYPDSTSEHTIEDGDCEDMNSSTTSGGMTITVDCVEK